MNDPAFTIALALAIGMIAQSAARHIRIPGIVLLLAGGILTGPDALNIIRPDTLGEALPIIVGFAVAVILFESPIYWKQKAYCWMQSVQLLL